ncbi:AIF_collapsed_G0031690.mRNA.1.CDS.1 [Saccharomyces cerevisiae]|nr:AIF_collapsed_G0031690.mRNA.1.CDS.1 [Saccharomyces cerevisiae]
MILANWRGFSGGQRDMFNEVLKYGSFIVDALVDYKQPIIIYIPPTGELRGGSWVVVDPTINADQMEMYTKPGHMYRLDDKYRELRSQLSNKSLAPELHQQISKQLADRERELLPIYGQMGLPFTDLDR